MTFCADPLALRALPALGTKSAVMHRVEYRRALLGVCIGIVIVIRLVDLFEPYPGDGAMFMYMGRLVSQGGGIGREMIDNKFPTVGLLMSGPWQWFGGYWPAWALMLAMMGIGGPFLLARSARRNLGEHTALPTLLFSLIFLNFSYGANSFHLEGILVFFAAIGASAALSAICSDDARDSFLVGLAAATGAMLKPSALAILAAFGAVMLLHLRSRPRRLLTHALAALLGAAIPAAMSLIYLSGSDLLGAVPVISKMLARYGAQSQWDAFNWMKWALVLLTIGFPILVRGFIFRRERDRVDQPTNNTVLLFALIWIAIEAAGVTMQGRMYKYHFLVLTPAAALLFGMLPRRDRAIPLIAALAMPLLLSVYGAIPRPGEPSSPTQRLALSDYLLTHARPGTQVWEDAMARLLDETGLQPGSRFLTTFLWANDDTSAAEYCPEMIADFERLRPEYIVLTTDTERHVQKYVNGIEELSRNPRRAAAYRHAWEQVRQYVQQHYVAEAQVGKETVFRRKPSAAKG
jgi:hypothetical protein